MIRSSKKKHLKGPKKPHRSSYTQKILSPGYPGEYPIKVFWDRQKDWMRHRPKKYSCTCSKPLKKLHFQFPSSFLKPKSWRLLAFAPVFCYLSFWSTKTNKPIPPESPLFVGDRGKPLSPGCHNCSCGPQAAESHKTWLVDVLQPLVSCRSYDLLRAGWWLNPVQKYEPIGIAFLKNRVKKKNIYESTGRLDTLY